MLRREEIVGHRITKILGDSTLSDESFNYTDFVFLLSNNIAFRIPFDDESGDLLPSAGVSKNHEPVIVPQSEKERFRKKLFSATVADVLVPSDPEERYPDSGLVSLSSGSFVATLSSGQPGIIPMVFLIDSPKNSGPLVSVWDAVPPRDG